MYELEEAEYQCPACQRSQPWRPESAGRPVTCACGVVLTIPFVPGTAEARGMGAPDGEEIVEVDEGADEDDDSGVVDNPDTVAEVLLCPDCGASMRPGAIVCPHCGYHRPKPKKRVFRRRSAGRNRLSPAAEHWAELTVRPFRDRDLPIGLSVAGLIVEISLLHHWVGGWSGTLAMIPLVVLIAAAAVAVIFPIALLLTPVLDLSLGPVVPLCVKLTAAVIFPPAVGVLMWAVCGQKATGIAMGWFAVLILYLSLFRLLFEFDWPDAMLLIAFVSLAQAAILLIFLLPMSYASGHVAAVWPLYQPMADQAVLTFLVAGGIVAPHFGQA